jgi:HAD superfamily hydrolase (TIGR01549 family)
MMLNHLKQKAVFFDLDDTLYDQLEPFRNAVKHNLSHSEMKEIPYDSLFRRVRHYSDLLWEQLCNGDMTLEALRIKRLTLAFAEFQISATDEQAHKIQLDYILEQSRITLLDDVKACISKLMEQDVFLGIITNGPVEHQLNKIRTLKLNRIIPSNRIFISDAIGAAKPDPQIFAHVNSITKTIPQQCYYIGDSWRNDVMGALNAGWHSIWFNLREGSPESAHKPELILHKYNDLIPYLSTH